MSEDYDFEKAFDGDDDSNKKRDRKAIPKPGTVQGKLKKDVRKFKIKTFKNDPRKYFRIVDCCANCKYSVFPKNKLRRGYCNLATNAKFRTLGVTQILKVNQNNLARNEVYAKYNWVRVHATNYCSKHWLDESKVTSIKRWIEGP